MKRSRRPGRRSRLRLLGAGIFLLLLAACGPSVTERMTQARALWDSGQLAQAAAAYDAIADDHPGKSTALEALYLSGSLHAFYLNQPDIGAARFARLAARFPDDPKADQARLHLGALLTGPLGKPEEAITVYRDLAEHGVTPAAREEGQYRLGTADALAAKPELARTEWRYLLERYRNGTWSEKAMFEIALSLDREGKTLEAMKAYEDFVNAFPNNPHWIDAQLAIADCLDRVERPNEALVLLRSLGGNSGDSDLIRARIQRIEREIRLMKLIKR